MGRSYRERCMKVEKGDVYIVRIGKFYKIGATRWLNSRLHSLQVGIPESIEVIARIKSNDMYRTERLFQAMFIRDDKLERGEWFNLAPADLAYIKAGSYSDEIEESIGDVENWTRIPEIIGEMLLA